MFGKKPQKVRNWYPKHGLQSDAHKNLDGTWTIERVRNFVYARSGSGSETWLEQVVVDVPHIEKMYYFLEPFTESDTIAHPYFVFMYEDGNALCVTIEGKRLNGEPYSGLKGVLNEYELGYVWITEKDCLTMPLTHGAKALFLHPLTFSPTQAQAVCEVFLRDTHQLFETPEFYHTIFNNCTGRFAHTLRRAGIRAPFDLSWYLPGWSDRYLSRLGYISTPAAELRDPARDLTHQKNGVWEIVEQSAGNYFTQILAKILPVR